MIFIISNSKGEAGLLAKLSEQRSWPCQACVDVACFEKLAEKLTPRVVVVRQNLRLEYSDDILASLKRTGASSLARVIVLAPANFSMQQEARQIALGADCVLRDPVRMVVLFEYLAKYRAETRGAPSLTQLPPQTYEFAGVRVVPHEHRLFRLNQSVHVAPQEIELLRLLSRSVGKVVPYPVLYTDLFNQRFAGDTANCRVLLGKIAASFRRLGVNLRTFIEVIPKSGYLYSARATNPRHLKSFRPHVRR